ncbi:uncharacterized protein LOC126893623 isoform X3 [Daktulosphaira vitifoliae]|uniref:uncharacterized protein LOC126893623 isoform X3 n=1 Tax=Daktulosphaira vitifoliae TaxID=58002 RepID=UPI0021A99986|nr:uncharacterized protein LOC126893623 isoform X3 [Daktulosphaira vitifoliae]
MEAVQQTVIHLDRPAMPSQAQMAYPQRNSQIHGNVNHGAAQVSGENSPFKTSSSGAGPVHNSYVGYPANVRYVSQPMYMPATTTVSNAYRDVPYHSRGLNISDRGVTIGVPFELSRSDMMPVVGRQNRISLLSATSDYYQRSRLQLEHYRDESLNHNSHNTVSMSFMRERPDHGPPPPLKKPKLLHPISPQQPLKIEIAEPPSTSAYNPQVEAISPTIDEPAPEYKKINDIAPKLSKIENDINHITREIEDLIKLKENYEQKELNPDITKIEPEENTINKYEEEDNAMDHLTPVQKIYASNRKKAHESRTSLEKFANKTDLPLYNQPSDADIYHENRRKYAVFKSRLLEHLRKKKMEQQQKKTEITETYSKLYKEWIRRVEKIESSQKKKSKEAKHRELFEKVFPELRKQREDKERFNRVGARIKSEADLEEIMDGLQEQEMEDKKMRSYAVIPPLMLEPNERHLTYLNNNGLVLDYKTEYNEKKYVNIWTQQEKDVFKDRFIAHPKNFGAIASYLDKKCPADCVKYYYLSKPKEEYKRLLRKAKWQARRRTAQSRTPASSSLNSLDILNSTSIGVTTRLQRERQGSEAASSNVTNTSVAQNHLPDAEETATSIKTPIANEQDSNSVIDNQIAQNIKGELNDSVSNHTKSPVPSHSNEIKVESKKKERRKDDKQKENTSTTDDELMDSRHENGNKVDVPKGICAVCKAENVACPRTLNPSDASQYGVKPEDIKPGSRVCNTCRCKVVRSQNRRVIYCPLPSCPTVQSNTRRPVKRLRPLPAKWSTAQDIIASEFQISQSTTKCCSACFNRIQRRLMALGVVGTTNNINTDSLDGWTDEETNALKKGIREHGTRWSEISKLVGPNKSHYHCKEFYFSFRKKLGLDLLVQEYKKANGSEQKPALTDEEESGSSTSSCDETNLVLCDSDTQSAPSPTNTLPQSSPNRETNSPSQIKLTSKETQNDTELNNRSLVGKEDYDSSATETADEGTGGTAENESSVLQHNSINELEKKDKNVTDISVSDILSDVIEKQFTKEHVSNREKENGSMPTISSILLDPEYPIKDRNTGSNNIEIKQSMATISVVPSPREHHHNKDSLVVLQVQSSKAPDIRVPEGVTLDLSIKKSREEDSYADPLPIKHAQPPPPPGTMYRPPPTQIHETNNFYSPQYAELGRSGKQGEIYWTKISPSNNHVMVHPSQSVPHVTVKQTSQIKLPNKVTSPQLTIANVVSSKLSPNMLNSSKTSGSIMHGTPVSAATLYIPPQSNRYSQSSQSSGGSITQGTPVHQRMLHNSSQNINPDYYQKRSSQYQSRQPHFSEQRQIIMNDYITSQQMHSNVTAQFPRAQKPPVTSSLYYQPTRQGVIQRHNTAPKVTSPQSYPPGHEALGSLVDVAIRQPSLPVPLTHSDDRHREPERFVRGSPVPKIYREQRHEQIQREREIVAQREREMQAVAQIREQQQREQYLREKQMMHHRLTPEQHSRMVASFQQQQRQQEPREQPRVMQIPSTVSSFQQSRSNTPVSRNQEPPSNIQNRDNGAASGRLSRQGMEHALTAANLIDAIITHQINQSNDGTGHPSNAVPTSNHTHIQQPRAGDKLFQAFPEANEKSAVKTRSSPEITNRQGEPYQSEHNFKEYPSYMLATGFEPHTWKLRRALQQKECEQQLKDDNNRVRFYPTQADIPLSPLDYVKNRIAEVMRTSDDDNKNEQAYTYPFSAAINMSSSSVTKNNETSDTNIGGGSGNSGSLLSNQYEPMSDED